MEIQDVLRLTSGTIRAHRLRTILTMLGIAIGTASVILLTSIGEGMRFFILAQFTQFGTNLLIISPGKTETFGMQGIATTTRKLTIEDAIQMLRDVVTRESRRNSRKTTWLPRHRKMKPFPATA